MDSFEWNKIIGAVLATALVVVVIRVGTEAVFEVPKLSKQAYVVQGVQATASSSDSGAPTEEPTPDFATAIPAADIAHGEQVGQKCLQCHDWTKGGPNKIGPNLWGIVNRARGTEPGFDYSQAMKTKGGTWTYSDLFHYLHLPAAFVPGNKMAFAGLPTTKDRLDLIAFLRTKADTPAPLPPPQPAATPAKDAGNNAAPAKDAVAPAKDATPPKPDDKK